MNSRIQRRRSALGYPRIASCFHVGGSHEGDTSISPTPKGAGLFQPVKPMLAARKAPENVVKLMEGRPFVIENKYDGERVQVHKDGKRIKLFSRYARCSSRSSGHEHLIRLNATGRPLQKLQRHHTHLRSHRYPDALGVHRSCKVSCFPSAQRWPRALLRPAIRCIIDGELLVWDSLAGRFEDFGKLKSLGTAHHFLGTARPFV